MKTILSLALLALLAVAPLRAWAEDPSAIRSAIEAQYARLNAAEVRKDPAPWTGLVAPDVQFLRANGEEQDLAGAMKIWQQVLPLLETVTARTTLQSVAAEGNAVRVVAGTVQEGTINQGGTAPFRVETTLHDTWEKMGTDWLLRRSDEVRSKTWINGVLVEDATAMPPLTPAQREAIVSELRTSAVPIRTVRAGSGLEDLAVLDNIVGDARIVALGEASHGTAEFFRMKHRLFEYLVEKKGFTVFAFESNWPQVEVANRYVRDGAGSAADALKGIFGIWQTQEVYDLIEWMRAYNSTPGRTRLLSFTAFDMQGPEAAAKCVIDGVSGLDREDVDRIRHAYDGVTQQMFASLQSGELTGKSVTDAEKTAFRANAAAALKLVEERRDVLLRTMTAAEYGRVHQCARIVVEASGQGVDDIADNAERDAAMAENVKWLAEEVFPREKIALWAHNAHVAAGTHAQPRMGEHLRKAFGEQLRVIGFAFDRGQIRALRLKDGKLASGGFVALTVPAANAGGTEALLRATGLPRFILDLRAVPAGSPLGTWTRVPHLMRTIGATYDPETQAGSMNELTTFSQDFDALIFIAESTASTLR
jgi:erythromycin esterase